MPPPTRSPRRTEALTRERIVATAVALLDAAGEDGLTFRALATGLSTGPGALYHHVANRSELLGAATDAVVAAALDGRPAGARSPRDGVRDVALALFEAIGRHPWLAVQLAVALAHPWRPTAPRLFEALGREVRGLDVPRGRWFVTTSALVHYVLGAAGQNAANERTDVRAPDRAAFLDSVATAWEGLDPDDYPFTRAVADEMRGHDDREQFLAGVDLILAGIAAG